MKTYAEKLKDPRWQRKRLEIMQRDDFTCRNCGDKTKTLNVHHIRYIQGREPWDYKEWYLVTLCEDCHENEEKAFKSVTPITVNQIKIRHPWWLNFDRYTSHCKSRDQYVEAIQHFSLNAIDQGVSIEDVIQYLWQRAKSDRFENERFAGWEIGFLEDYEEHLKSVAARRAE